MNFTQTPGIRTTTDSLLCPNITYTFTCEVSSDTLRLRSFRSDNSSVDSFNAFFGSNIPQSVQNEFTFTTISLVNGVAATAVMRSSIDLSSVVLECRDVIDNDFISLSTLVKRKSDHLSTFVNYICNTCFCFSVKGSNGDTVMLKLILYLVH